MVVCVFVAAIVSIVVLPPYTVSWWITTAFSTLNVIAMGWLLALYRKFIRSRKTVAATFPDVTNLQDYADKLFPKSNEFQIPITVSPGDLDGDFSISFRQITCVLALNDTALGTTTSTVKGTTVEIRWTKHKPVTFNRLVFPGNTFSNRRASMYVSYKIPFENGLTMARGDRLYVSILC